MTAQKKTPTSLDRVSISRPPDAQPEQNMEQWRQAVHDADRHGLLEQFVNELGYELVPRRSSAAKPK
ncbi:MAG: hypothetical protein DWQ37_19575 [Planctomycetota bacterium]|nr:MAG: hypothetical protein DWQ37_19575 [Planctomycetota bacterium]